MQFYNFVAHSVLVSLLIGEALAAAASTSLASIVVSTVTSSGAAYQSGTIKFDVPQSIANQILQLIDQNVGMCPPSTGSPSKRASENYSCYEIVSEALFMETVEQGPLYEIRAMFPRQAPLPAFADENLENVRQDLVIYANELAGLDMDVDQMVSLSYYYLWMTLERLQYSATQLLHNQVAASAITSATKTVATSTSSSIFTLESTLLPPICDHCGGNSLNICLTGQWRGCECVKASTVIVDPQNIDALQAAQTVLADWIDGNFEIDAPVYCNTVPEDQLDVGIELWSMLLGVACGAHDLMQEWEETLTTQNFTNGTTLWSGHNGWEFWYSWRPSGTACVANTCLSAFWDFMSAPNCMPNNHTINREASQDLMCGRAMYQIRPPTNISDYQPVSPGAACTNDPAPQCNNRNLLLAHTQQLSMGAVDFCKDNANTVITSDSPPISLNSTLDHAAVWNLGTDFVFWNFQAAWKEGCTTTSAQYVGGTDQTCQSALLRMAQYDPSCINHSVQYGCIVYSSLPVCMQQQCYGNGNGC